MVLHDVLVRDQDGGSEGGGGSILRTLLRTVVKPLAVFVMTSVVPLVTGRLPRLPLQVHLDTDEANACSLQHATEVELFRFDEQTGKRTVLARSVMRRPAAARL